MELQVKHNQADDLAKNPDMYDIVIDITNLPEVGKLGWTIQLSERLQPLVRELLEAKLKFEDGQKEAWLTSAQMKELSKLIVPNGHSKTVVSVVGLFDRGKTFLLNKLSGSRFPTGQRVHTKGLSITLPINGLATGLAADVILLDTEGTAAPLPRVRLSETWDAEWEAQYWAKTKQSAAQLVEQQQQAQNAPEGLTALEQGLLSKTPEQSEEQEKEAKESTDHLWLTEGQWSHVSEEQRGLSDAEWEQLEEAKERDRAKELMDLHEKAIVSKKVTESFLQNLVYTTSDVLLIVVNELTWPDQQFIASVCQFLTRNPRTEQGATSEGASQHRVQVVVVHNFKRTQTNKEFLECRKRYVENCFPGRISSPPTGAGQSVQIWSGQYHGVMLRHVFLACEGSEAGNTHNPGALAYLQYFVNGQAVGTADELLPRLSRDMRTNLRAYMALTKNSTVGILADRDFNIKMAGKNCGRLLLDHVVYRDNAVFVQMPGGMTPALDIVRNDSLQLVIADLPMPSQEDEVYPLIDPANYSAKIVIRPTSRDLVIAGKRSLFYRQVAEGKIIPNRVVPYTRELESVVQQERPSGDFERRLPVSYDLHHKPAFVSNIDGQLQVLIKKLED